ncbi:MAG: hypothetical protein IKN75_04395 [Prevotella sp.]|nr:hypothetical protein [Prevotella sp.]
MKKKLLLIIAAALVCGGNAMAEDKPQIPNGDFETWTYDDENLPNNWNSFQTADGSLASFGYSSSDRQVKRSTDTRPGSTGSSSCAIWARKISLGIFGSVIAQGNMTSGRVHAGGMSATAKDNYNYTDRDGSTTKNDITNPCAMKFTGKPKAVKVWVKYIQGGTGYGDHATAKFSAVIHGDGDYISYGLPSNDDVANKALVVASVTEEIPYTDGNWVELNLPFEYTNNGATPAYIQINASTNAYPGAGKEGDYLYIDDIEMVYESAADDVIALINAIGTVEYTDASKQKIDAARTAYDALTTDEKTEVTAETLKVLTDAEAKYAELKQAAADKAAADAAVEKITAIGEVAYTDESKGKIDAARTAYDGLTDAQKALVTDADVKVLTDAETKYAELKKAAEEAAAQAAADKAAAGAAVEKINAIGTVEYTETSKAKIDAARAAYDGLTDAQKALVTAADVKVLTDAEAKYAELKQAADEAAAQAEADKKAADAAIAKINAIGTVEYTDASKQKIDAARTAYDALTDAQKTLVTAADVKVLTDAETKYAELKQAAEEAAAQAEADKKAADAAIASINAIGEVAYTDESKGKIDAARKAYDALTDAQKALVTKETVAVLTAAEAKYAELKQAAEEAAAQAAADKAAAENAITHINAIGTVAYTGESKQKIDAARTAYNALTDAQKALVSADVVKVLTDAEAAYAELEQAADQAAKDKTAADAAIAKINAIGTVEYTDASKQKIDAARKAYDALTDAQKALVSADAVKTLTAAETRYAELKQAAEEAAAQAAKDKAAADAAIAKINAIGTVEYTDASKAKIDAARTAYDALTDNQQALVTASDLAKLTSAEAKYAELKKQAEEAAQQAEQAAKELAEAKTALSEGISEAKKYYESIKADYASVAATLQAAINAAAEVLNSATVTKAQADDAKAALAAAVKKAQDDVTVITGISTAKSEAGTADVWYDMNGRRLPGKPTTKGLYIRNGKKVTM